MRGFATSWASKLSQGCPPKNSKQSELQSELPEQKIEHPGRSRGHLMESPTRSQRTRKPRKLEMKKPNQSSHGNDYDRHLGSLVPWGSGSANVSCHDPLQMQNSNSTGISKVRKVCLAICLVILLVGKPSHHTPKGGEYAVPDGYGEQSKIAEQQAKPGGRSRHLGCLVSWRPGSADVSCNKQLTTRGTRARYTLQHLIVMGKPPTRSSHRGDEHAHHRDSRRLMQQSTRMTID